MDRNLAIDAVVKLLKRAYTADEDNPQTEAYNEIVRAEKEGDTETLLSALEALIRFCKDLKKNI